MLTCDVASPTRGPRRTDEISAGAMTLVVAHSQLRGDEGLREVLRPMREIAGTSALMSVPASQCARVWPP